MQIITKIVYISNHFIIICKLIKMETIQIFQIIKTNQNMKISIIPKINQTTKI